MSKAGCIHPEIPRIIRFVPPEYRIGKCKFYYENVTGDFVIKNPAELNEANSFIIICDPVFNGKEEVPVITNAGY